MPKFIRVEEIGEGMVLASPVTNKFNQTLLGPGTLLTAKHKSLLKTWGVQMLAIISEETSNEEVDTSVTQFLTDDAKRQLDLRLGWQPENPFEQDLYNMALKQILDTHRLPEAE